MSSQDPDNRRALQAAEFNMMILHQRQERGPFYFEPHTKSIQVMGSWVVRMNSSWTRNRSSVVHLRAHQTQVLQQQMMQQQRQQQAVDQAQQQMLYQQVLHQQALYAQQQPMQQASQPPPPPKEPAEPLIVYDAQGELVPKPKPNVTAFFHYSQQSRAKFRRLMPNTNLAEISKAMGQKWRNMTDEERKVYSDMAWQDKKRFDKEMEEYNNKTKLFLQNPHWAPKGQNDNTSPDAPSIEPEEPRRSSPPRRVEEPKKGRDTHKVERSLKCEICGGQQKAPGQLVSCASCNRSWHPPCIQLTQEATSKIKEDTNWKCIDCKVCEVCADAEHEDKLMICDGCDKGYHTFCLNPPLNRPPQGGWRCPACVQCVHCGARTPGLGASCKWRANYTACDSCYQLLLDKKYCPVCVRVYRTTDKAPMVQCDECNSWIHIQCDNIDEDTYVRMAKDDSGYKCPVCRKEKPEPNLKTVKLEKESEDKDNTKRDKRGLEGKEHTKEEKRKSRRRVEEEFVNIED